MSTRTCRGKRSDVSAGVKWGKQTTKCCHTKVARGRSPDVRVPYYEHARAHAATSRKTLNSHTPGQQAAHSESCWRPVKRRVYPCTCSFVFLKRFISNIIIGINLQEPEDGGGAAATGGFQHRGQRRARHKDICWATPIQTRYQLLDATLESMALFSTFIHWLIN